MKKIAVITVARSDYGIYGSLLRGIREAPEMELQLIVGGMHLAAEFGMTIKMIEDDGFAIDARVDLELGSDTPRGIAHSMGVGTDRYAEVYEALQPDMIVVLGDRFEMHSAALAALPFKIPVAHIHGGELTFGAIDDAMRHSITKLSHLHFSAAPEYAKRIVQLGEAPWRVTVCGAPSLDNLESFRPLNKQTMLDRFGLSLSQPPLLVTFHPVTLEYEKSETQVKALLEALRESSLPIVMTQSNADTSSRAVMQLVSEFVSNHNHVSMVKNLGTQGYFTLMSMALAMVGNSSSGIIESPSFKLPVVNVGRRQEGRIRAQNVIDVGNSRDEILEAIKQAISAEFRERAERVENPYRHGDASATIVEKLRQTEIDDRLLIKRFHDLAA